LPGSSFVQSVVTGGKRRPQVVRRPSYALIVEAKRPDPVGIEGTG